MHPTSRSERRHVREVARQGRRRIMKTWFSYRNGLNNVDLTDNIMWWAGKQAVAHGNRCSCHSEKILKKGQMRRQLKTFEVERDDEPSLG